MKVRMGLFVGMFLISPLVFAQHNQPDSTGLPGENFSLEGALELFKKSESPEAFEKMLNAEENKVNNLDLNGDGEIDYIRVIDRADGDVHAFVLQAVISENENQDVAVIEVEKNPDETARLQILGDEDIYGEQVIVEPLEEVKTNAGTQTQKVVVNVYTWPAIHYVYGPAYRLWVSPWGWAVRPAWWRPWRPITHHSFYTYWGAYRPRYVIVHTHRTVHAHRIYAPVRSTSVIVRTRHEVPVTRYRSRVTRTTTVTTPKGQANRKTMVVRTKEGKKVRPTKRTTRSRN